jgi:ribulose-5-phosphate 4-epimerase/fuculose-1-phosphate aldolase
MQPVNLSVLSALPKIQTHGWRASMHGSAWLPCLAFEPQRALSADSIVLEPGGPQAFLWANRGCVVLASNLAHLTAQALALEHRAQIDVRLLCLGAGRD